MHSAAATLDAEYPAEYHAEHNAVDAPTDTVRQLQARIRSMQATKLDSRLIATHPSIAGLLPGGGLKQGATYSVERSATLLMTLLAAPSAAGAWCAVVGMPEFGVEAASGFGIELERLVLVPHPGDQWLAVTAAVADVVSVVVTRPPKQASEGSIARLSARLRQRGSTLIVLGTWPQSEAMLSVSESSWSGIGEGHGHLAARAVTVTVTSRLGGRPRSARLWFEPKPVIELVEISAIEQRSRRARPPRSRRARPPRSRRARPPRPPVRMNAAPIIRSMVLWVPDWPIIALTRSTRLDPATPLALIEKGHVFACSPAARAEGVKRGLRVREAQSRCTSLHVQPYDPVIDHRAFDTVITAIEQLMPGVQLLRPGRCAIRARGPARYYGGEKPAGLSLIGVLGELGITGRTGRYR